MTTRTEKPEDSMSTATPTRAPHTDVPSGHEPAEGGRVGAGLFDPKQLVKSLPDAFRKLDPRVLIKSPVMFVVWIGSALTTVFAFKDPGDPEWDQDPALQKMKASVGKYFSNLDLKDSSLVIGWMQGAALIQGFREMKDPTREGLMESLRSMKQFDGAGVLLPGVSFNG